ncbi:conserved Plasmodium protein, unknown function [Plasmodium relictum]|uniref:Uncharacterized protein n=1 Tax=Plasmodium relictum TaxID=85471 RepID=A0A1J1H9W2_PLARL|nr:conserved Plasmodium protein, unknown function [Plasmodium relictum]CRH01708.1 conserved Plasmodium protein, unknown function [Plasmodium relictum]
MNNYSDTDSDSTIEETLVMLNFPQLNNDENKLKNFNIFRKKKEEKFNLESENKIKIIEEKKNVHSEKVPNSNNLSKNNTVNEINITDINLTKDNEHETLNNDNILRINKKDNNVNCNSYDTQENNIYSNNGEVHYNTNENIRNDDSYIINESNKDLVDKEKENDKTNEGYLDDNIIDNIPFEINNITLKNIFTETPQCIINNKYKFKGIQTSSIGTNLYFKEPESLKNKNDLKNYEISYDDFNRSIKNENKITRDNFTIYEGYSTKIISFEIDY